MSFGLVFDWTLRFHSRYVCSYPALYYLLVPYVLLRDCYCCQVCGKFGYWKIAGGSGWFCPDGRWFVGFLRVGCVRLLVHHLDGDKDNSDLDNLVTVCVRCHSWLGAGGHGMYLGYAFKDGHYVGYASRFRFREFWELVERRAPTGAKARLPCIA